MMKANKGIKKIGGIKKFQDMNKDTFIPETIKEDKRKKKLPIIIIQI